MKNSSNNFSQIYDKKYFTGKSSFFYKFGGYRNATRVWEARLKVLLKYKKRGKLLDIGCALGFMHEPFSKHFEMHGIDCSVYAIEEARKNFKGVFKVHNVEKPFPFKSNTFDVITYMDVLEHLNHPDKMIRNSRKVMKNGGILFLTTPNYNMLRKVLFYLPDKMEHHVSLHHINDIINKLKIMDFEILHHATGINVFDRSLWFKNRMGLEALVIARKE